MSHVLLGLGSNLSTPQRQLCLAIKSIKNLPKTTVLQVAPVFRNGAWGKKSVPDFYNTVLILKTELSPMILLNFCQAIENKHGRVRRTINQARTLDIDILKISNYRSVNPRLILPHPRMHERIFVLQPLQNLDISLLNF